MYCNSNDWQTQCGQSVPSQLLDLVLLFARMLLQHDVLLEEAKVAVRQLFSGQLCDDRPLWNIHRILMYSGGLIELYVVARFLINISENGR